MFGDLPDSLDAIIWCAANKVKIRSADISYAYILCKEVARVILYPKPRGGIPAEGEEDGTGTGMGWFPGYAIDIETGERLNIIFSEDSWLAGENGRAVSYTHLTLPTILLV